MLAEHPANATSKSSPGAVPTPEQFQRLTQERDYWKRIAHESTEKLSVIAAAIQNPALSWKERGSRAAVALAIEYQRPKNDPTGEFEANLGDLAKRAGLIPPTPPDDPEAFSKAWKQGRKQAGQILKEFAEGGVIDSRYISRTHDRGGNVTNSTVVIKVDRPHVEVVRAAAQLPGTRSLQQARHHNGARPYCKDCGPDAPVIEKKTVQCICGQCGQILSDPVTTKRQLPEASTSFQSLETLGTDNTGEDGGDTSFQSLENGQRTALDELKEVPQWVIWKYLERDGKRTKPPYDPATGNEARSNDPATWGTIAEAWAAKRKYDGAGVGFMFHQDYIGVDIDKCRDPETGAIDAEAQAVIDELRSYTEVSPSGTGVHILLRGSLPAAGRRKGNLEMYDGGRYFTVTGQHVDGTPHTIEDRGEALSHLHVRIFPPVPPRAPIQRSSPTADDQKLIEDACRANHPVPFEPLWRGEYSQFASEGESGRHRADYWLCKHLAFWTRRDQVRMDQLFRKSGLMRDKWDRSDGPHGTYGQRTIRKALGDA